MVPVTAAPPAPSARRTELAPIRVAVLDVHHPGSGGLELTALLARRPDSPSVVLRTALLSDRVTLAAAVAGAVATVDKAVAASELVATARFAAPDAVGGGGDAVARCRGADTVVTRRPATQLPADRGVASGVKRVP